MLKAVERAVRVAGIFSILWEEETDSPLRFRHIGLWRHGLVSSRYEMYGLATNDPALYVSDFMRVAYARRINPPVFVPILANKFVFHRVLRPDFDKRLPQLLGTVANGTLYSEADGAALDAELVLDLLDRVPAAILKPGQGGGGKGVHLLQRTPETLRHNRRVVDPASVVALLRACSGFVLEEFVQQHPYAHTVFPDSVNTIRVSMMRADASEEPFIPIAVHRFGTTGSGPTDNFGRGGLSARIDLTTGRIGPAGALSEDGSLVWHSVHPITGAPIDGATIPHWDDVKQLVFDLANAFPYLAYVGWDVVVTADGPKVLEGNHYMAPRVLQIHQPLLADDRVRDFYRRHRIPIPAARSRR